MRIRNLFILTAIAASAACASLILPSSEWTANVQPRGNNTVEANVSANAMQGLTSVAIAMIGGQPGGQHPWHIHYGSCATGGDIVGDAGSYPALRPDQAGGATAEARVRAQLRPGEEYHVNVHRSPQALGDIVACGNLRIR